MNKKNFVYTAAAFAVALGGLKFADYVVGLKVNVLPACDAVEVVQKAKEVIKSNPAAQVFDVRDFEHPVEIDYDSKAERRVCMATLRTAVGQERARYTVQWHDKKAKIFWLEFVPS